MAIASVRAATPDDVDEIIRIQAETWTVAYAKLLPEAALQRVSGPAARQAWHAAVTAGDGHHVFVATEGNWTVGFCAVTSAEPDDRDPDSTDLGDAADPGDVTDPGNAADRGDAAADDDGRGTLAALLVEPRWGRRGHGGRLFEAATSALRADGARVGAAWVLEQDVVSRAFYARRQWESDGLVRVLDAGDRELREIRLVGPLGADDPATPDPATPDRAAAPDQP
ncbi:MAG: GNAT family N-acetyltransferase [Actinomycetota bacterium]|nr:GNAT family N-acetyltransferase [Actinomycetota bacterium]